MIEHSERDLTGLYALGALTDAERAAFEAHLERCPICAEEVRSFAPVATSLAWAAPAADPPADLRARVLAAVTGRRDGEPIASIHDDRSAARPARSVVPAWLAAAASLALAAGLAVYAMQLRGRIADLERGLAELTARATQAERQVADARLATASAEGRLAILLAPDTTRTELAGQSPVAPTAQARAYWSRSRGMVFTASGLPPLPPDRIYQLWYVTPDAAVSAGLLAPDPSGGVTALFELPPGLGPLLALAVTREPSGGVPAPTGEKYLVGLTSGP